MAGRIDATLLQRRWLHSHEEDTPTEAVYRPADHDLPPARGRTGFELKPDRTAVSVGPGPADAPVSLLGSWEIDEEGPPALRLRLKDGQTQVLPIVAAGPDRLVIRK